jgi:glucose-6-phosphate-specific signal transduction histidine kinase
MMQGGFWAKAWTRNLTIAVAYCAALVLFRQLSIPHWIILTGFHLSVLLLTKYKYWPALIAGDAARLAYVSITCYDQFGLLWSVVNLVPSICYFIPIVWLFRERWQLFPQRLSINMGALVLCSLLVACAATVVSLGQILITPFPPGYVLRYGQLTAQLILGNFLGILTITPITLVFRQLFLEANGSWRQLVHDTLESRLVFDAVLFALPAFAFMVWMGEGDPRAQQIAQMAMFLPVAWLALRHGWKGAAIGGTLASFGIMILMPARNDHATLQAEILVAMAISTMLLAGARIALLDRRVQQERADMRNALALAQRNVNLGEVQLRNTALALDQIRDSFHSALLMLASRLSHLRPVNDDGSYQRQALSAQDQLHRLADGLYPNQIGQRGLPRSFREGPFARMLDEAGMVYWCEQRGQLSAFSHAIHLAVYRIIGEAVAERCLGRDVSDVHVIIRCGQHRRRWVVIQIDVRANPVRLPHIRWDSLLPRLQRTTSGMGHAAIVDRAATFEGKVRVRSMASGQRVSVLLLDPIEPGD